jgi:hypothetical protein
VINVKSQRVQCDEIWPFVYSKENNKPQGVTDAGDPWTWTAIDADSKLILSRLVADRSANVAREFMIDVAVRLANKVN